MYLKYFTLTEFDCQETGENEMSEDFLLKLDKLRDICGFPFIITSGYRSTKHSIEAAKTTPGTHAKGIACDIRILTGTSRFKLVAEALKLGFTGVGIAKGFVHVDTRGTAPTVWSY